MSRLGKRIQPAGTERLRFREMDLGDLDFLAELLGNPEVMRWYPRVLDREGARQWIERQLARYQRDGNGLWLVTRRDDGAPVGQIGLSTQQVEGDEALEIGWLLHRDHWGRGYATEAARACRDLGFAESDVEVLISLIRPVNTASAAVARRLGMRPGRRVRYGGFEHIVFELPRPR